MQIRLLVERHALGITVPGDGRDGDPIQPPVACTAAKERAPAERLSEALQQYRLVRAHVGSGGARLHLQGACDGGGGTADGNRRH